MTQYILTTGGDDGLTDEMLRGFVQVCADADATYRLAMIAVQLERQLPHTFEIDETCHIKNGICDWSANMTVKGIDGNIIWVLYSENKHRHLNASKLVHGPRPS